MIGLHTVTVGGTDISCLVDSVAIHHGRDDTDSQPEASSCTLDISTDTQDADLPATLDVGALVKVTTTVGGTVLVRFSGKVTDISQGWDEAGEETPDEAVAQVIATGSVADLGRRTVGDTPWPQQLDGARVSAILAAAGVVLSPATSDPGTVQILARDVDSQPALDLAQAVASDAGGIVWTTRNGEIRYADADHRRGTQAALVLDACDVLVTPTWQRTTAGLINDVSIGYGVAADGADQPRYTASRQDSISKWGEYSLSSSTQLAALADATAMGNLLLTRNREPVWILSALPIDVADLTQAETVALLSLELGDLITVTGLPAAGTVPTTATLWVEGWTETLTWAGHQLELTVSGYCRTVPAPRWNDLDPALTWDQMGTTWVNRMTNPNLELNTQFWGSSNSALWPLVRDTTAPIYGAASAMTTRAADLTSQATSVSTVQVFAPEVIGGGNNIRLTCQPGDEVSFRYRMKIEAAPRTLNGYISWRSDTGGSASPATSTPVTFTATAVGAYSITVTGTAPAGCVAYIPTIYVTMPAGQGNAHPGERIWLDALLVQTNGDSTLGYWDGDTADTPDYGYSWAGAQHASQSLRQTGSTWDDATCLGPQPNRGRWDDVPATTRWNTVTPTGITWDKWPNT